MKKIAGTILIIPILILMVAGSVFKVKEIISLGWEGLWVFLIVLFLLVVAIVGFYLLVEK